MTDNKVYAVYSASHMSFYDAEIIGIFTSEYDAQTEIANYIASKARDEAIKTYNIEIPEHEAELEEFAKTVAVETYINNLWETNGNKLQNFCGYNMEIRELPTNEFFG